MGDVMKRDTSPQNKPKAMYPSPETLIFGEDEIPTIDFKYGDKSLFNQMIDKANAIIDTTYKNKMDVELSKYKTVTVGAIKYPSPNGKFPDHVDHCNSYVYLMSIGCDANFTVKGPNMEKEKVFAMKSGDLLIFDSSTKAKISHGVRSIGDSSTCPVELGKKYKLLQSNRLG